MVRILANVGLRCRARPIHPGAQTERRSDAEPVRFSLRMTSPGDLLNVSGRGRKLLCGALATNG
jgi:hypothetical protein